MFFSVICFRLFCLRSFLCGVLQACICLMQARLKSKYAQINLSNCCGHKLSPVNLTN